MCILFREEPHLHTSAEKMPNFYDKCERGVKQVFHLVVLNCVKKYMYTHTYVHIYTHVLSSQGLQ